MVTYNSDEHLFRKATVILTALVCACCKQPGFAVGTVAGTDIANTVQVDYLIAGTPQTTSSNTVTITVAEVLDVDVTNATATLGALANNGGFARTHAILPVVRPSIRAREPVVL